ncbi:hypothetical protein C0992_000635 [Termitomyces sp. T32_za158]|nr:hypothetical protein C0992_000635 [Termitomyces sp. T32_za158]
MIADFSAIFDALVAFVQVGYSMPPLCFAYYCSGHGEHSHRLLIDYIDGRAGYGHATRVSAFACHLLNLPVVERPNVYITSSAPKHVFSDSIALGALYRYAEIDPVIVQPLAYRVDRQKSVEVLKSFLSRKEHILETERKWLEEIGAHAVLSDAAFLGCLAANSAGIPSILITNFTFDSVYSYLSTPLLQVDLEASSQPDHLTPSDTFTALVPDIAVPSTEIDSLVAQIHEGYRCADLLLLLPGYIPIPSFSMYPSLPAPDWVDASSNSFHKDIVESLSRTPSPCALHPSVPFHPTFHLPSKPNPPRSVVPAPLLVRPPSTTPSPYSDEGRAGILSSIGVPAELHDPVRTKVLIVSFGGQVFRAPSRTPSRNHSRSNTPSPSPTVPSSPHSEGPSSLTIPSRLATPSHIWIPGAPPTSRPPASAVSSSSYFDVPELTTMPPTPNSLQTSFDITPPCFEEDDSLFEARLLPDESWIAIVCVSRPLFIEEHGLRLLLDKEGVGVELSRQSYEAGDWALAVEEAWVQGKGAKERKRAEASAGIAMDDKRQEGLDMARKVVSWTQGWWMS